jgi:hypothetical protein
MARAPRESGPPRRRRTEAAAPRKADEARPLEPAAPTSEAPAAAAAATSGLEEPAALQASGVVESESRAEQTAGPTVEEPLEEPRFHIFIIDSGWNSPAHKVLRENFGLIRDLQKEDPIYVLSREQSIEYISSSPDAVGKDPIISVHDLKALSETGRTGFHGFRLRLGVLRTEQQALLALQAFCRFLVTNRQSVDMEAQIRRDLRREGIIGAIEIILHHEPREIGA